MGPGATDVGAGGERPGDRIEVEAALARLEQLLDERIGQSARAIESGVRWRLLEARAHRHGVDVDGYLSMLASGPGELVGVARALFGAEPLPAETEVLNRLARGLGPCPKREAVRAWVIGCGAGATAYRLAFELLAAGEMDAEQLTVFATDLDETELADAGRGRLDRSTLEGLTPGPYVEEGGDQLVLRPSLRSRFAFAAHDLLRTPPFRKIDALVCRQRLGWLEPSWLEQAVERLAFALRPGGMLAVPPEIELDQLSGAFERFDAELGLYRRRSSVPATRALFGPARLQSDDWRASRLLEQALFASVDRSSGRAAVVLDRQGRLRLLVAEGHGLLQGMGIEGTSLERLLEPRLGRVVGQSLAAAREDHRPVQRSALVDTQLFEVSVHSLEDGFFVELWRLDPPANEMDGHRGLELELAWARARYEERLLALEASHEQLRRAHADLLATHRGTEDLLQEQSGRRVELEVANRSLEHRVEVLEALGEEVEHLFESGGVAAVFLGPDGRVARFSSAVAELVGVEPTVGAPLSLPGFSRELGEAVASVLDGSGAIEIERAARGRHLLVRIRPLELTRTIGPGAVVTFTDLSTVWQDSEATETRTRQLASLFESADDPTVECDLSGQVSYANAAARALLGGATGGSLLDALRVAGASEPEAVLEAFEAARHGLRRPRVPLVFPASGLVFDVTARPIYASGRVAGVVVAARDVTEFDNSRKELAASRALMQAVLDSLGASIAVVDRNGRVVTHNRSWADNWVFPGASAGVGASLLAALDAERAGGRESAGLVASHLREALEGRAGAPVCQYPLASAEQIRHIETSAVRLSHAGEELAVVVQQDVTSVKLAEQQRLDVQAKLLDADKLESLGVLAGGVAHDFNNLLVGILSNASFASATLAEGSVERDCVNDIEMAAERAAELCQQLLAFSGRGQFQLAPLRIDAVVQESLRLLQASVDRSVSLDVVLPSCGVPPVVADESQVKQVLFNLVSNGAEAVERGGTVRVTVGVERLDADRLSRAIAAEAAKPGRHVYLRVVDDGPGMSQEVAARAFEPFFSTKFTGRGLGLAAVRGIVQGHRGVLELSSAPGVGTTMTAFFPVEDSLQSRTESAHPIVLVVDDEDVVRGAASRALQQSGFRVVEARRGEEALERFGELGETVALVLLDVTMPGMSGETVFSAIRARDAVVPVLFSSGRPALTDRGIIGPDNRAYFLDKPYRALELVERVRSILGIHRDPGQA